MRPARRLLQRNVAARIPFEQPRHDRRQYVREEALEAQFTELLGRLKFDDEVLEWVRDALHASHADERREHEDAISAIRPNTSG